MFLCARNKQFDIRAEKISVKVQKLFSRCQRENIKSFFSKISYVSAICLSSNVECSFDEPA